jgi:hypothetical protein
MAEAIFYQYEYLIIMWQRRSTKEAEMVLLSLKRIMAVACLVDVFHGIDALLFLLEFLPSLLQRTAKNKQK